MPSVSVILGYDRANVRFDLKNWRPGEDVQFAEDPREPASIEREFQSRPGLGRVIQDHIHSGESYSTWNVLVFPAPGPVGFV